MRLTSHVGSWKVAAPVGVVFWLVVLDPRAARAESIADAVRSHVEQGLEHPPPRGEKPPPVKPAAAKPAPRAPHRRAPSSPPPPPPRRPVVRVEPSPPELELLPSEPSGPPVPRRVIGRNLESDPKLGGGIRGWMLQQYPSVHVSSREYFTWSFDMNARLFRLINIRRGYYESNDLAPPRTSGAAVAAQVGDQIPKAAWLLGVVGVPITKVWEPVIRYETRAFQTTAVPGRPVRIVPHDTPPSTDLAKITPTTSPLTMVSGFETLVLALQYNNDEDSSAVIDPKAGPLPPIYFGAGFTQYRKPYQVSVGDSVLDSVMFDARFRGAGLAVGTELPTRPDHFFLRGSAQVGLGEVRLLDSLTLNELLPTTPGRSALTLPEWLIGYVQGDVAVGYLYPLLRTAPSVLVSVEVNGGGATFFYFKTKAEQGQPVSAPPLNWDFLWGARAGVTVPL